MEWLPIETAPKDGATILIAGLVRCRDEVWNECAVAWWDVDAWVIDYTNDDGVIVEPPFEPTFWTQLPPPPAFYGGVWVGAPQDQA